MNEGEPQCQPMSMGMITDAWSRTSEHMLNSFYKANRAALAAFGVPTPSGELDGGVTTPVTSRSTGFPVDSWDTHTTVHEREEIEVGDLVEFSKTITEADVDRFAAASGDTNPLHLDEEFASETRFGDRIAHGALVSGLISAALARLPGMVIYLSQDTTFLHPVQIGERLTARCEVVEEIGDDRYRLATDIVNDEGEKIIEGEAIVMIDEVPEALTEAGART